MNITGSNDISVLDFAVLFNLSAVTPTITITNQSVGTGLADCTWWYKIVDPSGAIIHEGTEAIPDETGVWNTILVPDTWPQPFGQVNYSGTAYTVQLFVKDGDDKIFSLEKAQEICRPKGVTPKTKGNFGTASLQLDLRCDIAKLYANDTTSYTYKGNTGTQVSKTFKVDYPLDDTGARPPMFVLNNFQAALVPVPINGDGYTIFLDTIMDYTFDNDITVRIKYKHMQQFAVYCNIDLCPLMCSYQKLVDDVQNGKCFNGSQDHKESQEKLTIINAKMAQALIAKMQPGCGIDLPKLIEEIKTLGGFECDCYTTGNNGTESGALNITFDTCGNIVATATVNGDNILFNFKVNDVVVALTENMENAGFSLDETINPATCTKTYTIDLTQTLGSNCPTAGPIYVHETSVAPAACPDDFYGTDGQNVWNVADDAIIGVAHTPQELVHILNSNAGYRALGIAVVLDNCTVAWYCLTGAAPVVHVSAADPEDPGCIDTFKTFPVDLLDYCDNNPIASGDYPATAYVQYTPGGAKIPLGVITSPSDLVTKLMDEAGRPANQTYSQNAVNTKINIIIEDENCLQENTTTVFYNKDTTIVYGANHHSAVPDLGAVQAMEMNTLQYMGKICTIDNFFLADYPYHVMRMGNYLFVLVTGGATGSGQLWQFDITNPLVPTVYFGGTVPQPPGCPHAAFTNLPLRAGQPSYWDGFFPTDINAQNTAPYVYFSESATGCIWRYLPNVNFTAYFFAEALIGKCPRVVANNKLYFTHDGFMETQTGQVSGVPRNHIVILDLNIFNAGAITTMEVTAVAGDEPWGMCIDPDNPNNAYIVTKDGDVIEFDLATDTVGTLYNQVFTIGGTQASTNVVIHDGIIYQSSYGDGTENLALSSLGSVQATAFENLLTPSGAGPVLNVNHYNFRPVPGTCYGLLTYDNGSNEGGVAKYTLGAPGTGGKFMGRADLPAGDMYNVVPIENVSNGFPNGLC